MNDEMINYIGIAIMAVVFWYLNIYRPKKKLKNPGELLLQPLVNASDKKLFRAVNAAAGSELQALHNINLGGVIYSPKLSNKKFFRDAINKIVIEHVIVDDEFNPILAVVYSSPDEDTQLTYLANAGIGCCVFQRDAGYKEIVDQLKTALSEIQSDASPALGTTEIHAHA